MLIKLQVVVCDPVKRRAFVGRDNERVEFDEIRGVGYLNDETVVFVLRGSSLESLNRDDQIVCELRGYERPSRLNPLPSVTLGVPRG